MKKAVNNILKIISYPLMYQGMQIFVVFIYMFAVGIFAGIRIVIDAVVSGDIFFGYTEDEILDSVMSQVSVSVPLILSNIACLIIIFSIFKKAWKTENFWSTRKIGASSVVLCLILGAALNFFTVGVLNLMQIPETEALDFIFNENIIFQFLAIGLIGPALEEIIFRGIVQKRLLKMVKVRTAIFLQALVFGVIHFNITQGIYAFFLGLIMGIIYLWFDSIWAVIAVHAAFNSTSVIVGYIAGDAGINSFTLIVMTVTALAASVAVMAMLAGRKPVKTGDSDYNYNNNRWAY